MPGLLQGQQKIELISDSYNSTLAILKSVDRLPGTTLDKKHKFFQTACESLTRMAIFLSDTQRLETALDVIAEKAVIYPEATTVGLQKIHDAIFLHQENLKGNLDLYKPLKKFASQMEIADVPNEAKQEAALLAQTLKSQQSEADFAVNGPKFKLKTGAPKMK